MTEQVFLPSWWLASGLLDAALRGESPDLTNQSTREALKFLGLILANALLLSLIASWVARWTYRKGYSNLQAEVPTVAADNSSGLMNYSHVADQTLEILFACCL